MCGLLDDWLVQLEVLQEAYIPPDQCKDYRSQIDIHNVEYV